MRKCIIAFLFISFLTLTSFMKSDEVVNYYSIPKTVKFNKLNYQLSWSAHPTTSYYKQEYLPQGETGDHFNNMIMIDFIQTGASVKEAVTAQVNKILERKKTDAVCNYEVNENPDGTEFILDFLMSESKGSEMNLLEWSAYHYKAYTDQAGHRGILLFGICHRAYGEETGAMLKGLKTYRTPNINELIGYPMPEIQIK